MTIGFRFKGGSIFTVLAMQTDTGAPLDVARLIEEALDTAGVNGRRWRTINAQHQAMRIRTISAAADFAAAIDLAEGMLTSARSVRTISIGGADGRTLNGLHVTSIDPVPVPGPLASGDGSTGNASVVCTWVLEFTDASQD